MSTARTEVESQIESLPKDRRLEDVQYHLYVLERVKSGLERAEKEGALAHEEVAERTSKWLFE